MVNAMKFLIISGYIIRKIWRVAKRRTTTRALREIVTAEIASILAILLLSDFLFAQGIGVTTGTLAGDVSDESGLPIANVLVTITGPEGAKTATTDERGKYIFPYLTPAQYNVRAEFQGYTTVEQFDVGIGLARRFLRP